MGSGGDTWARHGFHGWGLGTCGRTGDEAAEAILAAVEIGYRHLDKAQSCDFAAAALAPADAEMAAIAGLDRGGRMIDPEWGPAWE